MRLVFVIALLLIPVSVFSQTVGTLLNESETSEGFTLFHPLSFDTTYLINNCGERINQWPSNLPNGGFAGLKSNGNLVKSLKFSGAGAFTGGGITGRIVEQDWSGAVIWEYSLADSNYHLHHDVHILPNENLLVIAWEKKSVSECIAAGRDSNNIPSEGLWPCVVFEVEPVGNFSSVVWEWHSWDHLVQDFDPTKANYGDLLLNKSRIDVNKGNPNNGPDWIHLNGMDYNEDLDMIVLSSPMLNEIFIIDHSTSSAEASSNSGGLSGQGGDLLWRWGNPVNYNGGVTADQQLYFQHDPQWVDRGTMYTNMISVFSNQEVVNSTDVSKVKIIEFPFDSINYTFPVLNNAYLPETSFFEYQLADSLFSAHISGVEVQENNNILIAAGNQSTYIEIDTSSQIVWSYLAPIKTNGQIASQGETGLFLKRLFQPKKYPVDFSGFVGHDTSPSSPIEQNPLPCVSTVSLEEINANEMYVFPNPATDQLIIESSSDDLLSARLYSASGTLVKEFKVSKGQNYLSIKWLNSGIFYLNVESKWIKVIVN
ncbi:MAG: aryl-sulfate sulfotransferase [Crocinitomicaceae bacterium]|nr:aryl-sulfate sulfotransferase [Flavobacteriales bacterium]NQZ36621.1 aryl-sulfate sulfotransferase [Crocinitomicaceae bacterium]